MISKKITAGHIINLVESVEECKLVCCNKSKGHFLFYSSDYDCSISCTYDKQKKQLSLLCASHSNGFAYNSWKKTWKLGGRK